METGLTRTRTKDMCVHIQLKGGLQIAPIKGGLAEEFVREEQVWTKVKNICTDVCAHN